MSDIDIKKYLKREQLEKIAIYKQNKMDQAMAQAEVKETMKSKKPFDEFKAFKHSGKLAQVKLAELREKEIEMAELRNSEPIQNAYQQNKEELKDENHDLITEISKIKNLEKRQKLLLKKREVQNFLTDDILSKGDRRLKNATYNLLAMPVQDPVKNEIFLNVLARDESIEEYVNNNIVLNILLNMNDHIKFAANYGLCWMNTNELHKQYLANEQLKQDMTIVEPPKPEVEPELEESESDGNESNEENKQD